MRDTGIISLPLHTLNTNRDKRMGDRQGWPIPRNLSSQGADIKQDKK